jgi:hypothetical protein
MDGGKQDGGKRGFKPKVDFGGKRPGARGFVVSPEGVFVHKDGALHTLADAVDIFWSGVARDPGAWTAARKGYDYLLDHAATASREDVRQTLNWLELAIARRDRTAAVAAARYLSLMPAPLLAADYGRLLSIFNSRILGMVWQVTPDLDLKPLPPRIPKFGREAGFGLIRSVPELYRTLAMFGPEMEDLVTALATEALRYGVSLPPELAAMAEPPSATE